jgi:hypothetical protein
MGEPISEKIRFVSGKDLGLSLETPKCGAMDDASIVSPNRAAIRF